MSVMSIACGVDVTWCIEFSFPDDVAVLAVAAKFNGLVPCTDVLLAFVTLL